MDTAQKQNVRAVGPLDLVGYLDKVRYLNDSGFFAECVPDVDRFLVASGME